jgi:hypothetical protein
MDFYAGEQTEIPRCRRKSMTFLHPTSDTASVPKTMEEPTASFSNDFFGVALFSGTGLVISLIAAICNEQGVWL